MRILSSSFLHLLFQESSLFQQNTATTFGIGHTDSLCLTQVNAGHLASVKGKKKQLEKSCNGDVIKLGKHGAIPQTKQSLQSSSYASLECNRF